MRRWEVVVAVEGQAAEMEARLSDVNLAHVTPTAGRRGRALTVTLVVRTGGGAAVAERYALDALEEAGIPARVVRTVPLS
jgi:hypothetical protein